MHVELQDREVIQRCCSSALHEYDWVIPNSVMKSTIDEKASGRKKAGPWKYEMRDWVEYRQFANLEEVDFHIQEPGHDGLAYWERMAEVYEVCLRRVKLAQAEGVDYLLFTHGWSTSRPGNTTSRSQVRKFMRSKDATPYIIRRQCVQHPSVFLAKIRRKKD